jgi:hypothetical protein
LATTRRAVSFVRLHERGDEIATGFSSTAARNPFARADLLEAEPPEGILR